MDDARDAIRRTLAELKAFLARDSISRLSEADTRAFFIEPIIAALGWIGIDVVTREYYIKNSQEFIDYVLSGSSSQTSAKIPVLAIETKAVQSDLTEKNAAQLVQYCAVEGIEWGALTNARELQFFNTFLKPDLAAKRVMRLDLLAFNSDEEFDVLFLQLWRLSQQSITTASVHTWLNQLRLDQAVRDIVLNPGSSTIKHLRRVLADAEVRATPQELVQWFCAQFTPPIPRSQGRTQPKPAQSPEVGQLAEKRPSTSDSRLNQTTRPDTSTAALLTALQRAVNERFPDVEWRTLNSYTAAADAGRSFLYATPRIRARSLTINLILPGSVAHPRVTDDGAGKLFSQAVTVSTASEIDDDLLDLIEVSRKHARIGKATTYYGVNLKQLVDNEILPVGTPLIFVGSGTDLARAHINRVGEIVWQGQSYRALSSRVFSALLGPGRVSVNGWTQWYAELPAGRVQLAELRIKYLAQLQSGEPSSQHVKDAS